jgi:cytochrome P450
MTAVDDQTSSVQQRGDEVLGSLFFTPEGIADPTPSYHRLRELAPVHHSGTGTIFLTRFDDCNEILRDNRFGKGNRDTGVGLPSADPEAAAYRAEQRRQMGDQPQSMLFLDPPDHTRQRRLVSRAFTPRRVEQMRERIADLAHGCVDRLADARQGDLLDLVGFPLPVAVIGAMVGVPEADWPRFRSLITTGAVGIEPTASVEDLRAAEAANQETWDYFVDLVAERRARPQDDLLSDLIAVEESGDQLAEDEIIIVAILLFAAGFETTTNLIGNGMGALLRNPAEMERLWGDESLLPTAVEEMLRWDSPVQFDVRTALQDANVAGGPVPEGTQVVTLLGAANRDPLHFVDPDRFDVGRDEGTPMSFASGIHFCLGANLARVEGREVFRALRDRFAAIELDGELVQRPRTTLRGYEAVPVRVTPR